jgi:hypothetical protein
MDLAFGFTKLKAIQVFFLFSFSYLLTFFPSVLGFELQAYT